MEHMTKQSQKLALMFGIGALVGVALAHLLNSGAPKMEVEMLPMTPSTTAVAMGDTAPTLSSARAFPLPPTVPMNTRVGLSVLDQTASSAVMVAQVAVTAPSWVAVYEDTAGTPGAILGAKKVVPGETFTVVPLLREEGTQGGKTYFAVVLPDNGDGAFDHKSDTPPLTPDLVVMVKFQVK